MAIVSVEGLGICICSDFPQPVTWVCETLISKSREMATLEC